jgi:hypothetical protein
MILEYETLFECYVKFSTFMDFFIERMMSDIISLCICVDMCSIEE